jgi:molybdate transport system substrate-binding protein
MTKSTAWLGAVSAALLLIAVPCRPASAQTGRLQVMTSGGFAEPLKKLLPEFEHESGISVSIAIGKSQGAGDDTINAQLAHGAAADMVVLTREGMNDLIGQGRIVAHSDVDIAKSPLGVAVRAGQPKPDIGTVAAFKKTLLEAKSLAYPGSTTGFYVSGTLYPKLNAAKELQAKSSNIGVAGVAAGKAQLAIQAITELIHAPGADYVGLVPKELQYDTVFAAALVTGTGNDGPAKKLIAFLASDKALAVLHGSGMEAVRQH